jgi:hypothetical protein
MSAHEKMSAEQFHAHMVDTLGPESEGLESGGKGYEWGKVPPYVFRTMSDEEYQQGTKQGFFKSDERNNWRSQQRALGNHNWHTMPEEGTVAGVSAYTNYLPNDKPGRIVKFDTSKHEGWEVHPDVKEGDYIRTKGHIPADSVTATTKPVILQN